jgi:methylmalonyl-CoA/ethylmalonyl-CoA epimerase
MNHFGLIFDHLGLAVRKPESAYRFLEALGYTIGESVFDPEQNVRLCMCAHPDMPHVEIICPADAGKSPVDRLVARHDAGIVYHVCYRSENLAASLAAMETAGVRLVCVSSPKPAVLFGGERVSFYMIDGMGLIEILENPA